MSPAVRHLHAARQALAILYADLANAAEFSQTFSSARTPSGEAWIYQFLREEAETSDHSDTAVTLSTEQGIAAWLAGTILRSCAVMTREQDEPLRQSPGADVATARQDDEAHKLLGPVCSCLNETLGTADLKAAKVLFTKLIGQ